MISRKLQFEVESVGTNEAGEVQVELVLYVGTRERGRIVLDCAPEEARLFAMKVYDKVAAELHIAVDQFALRAKDRASGR